MYIMYYTFHSLDNEHKGANIYEKSITECETEGKILYVIIGSA